MCALSAFHHSESNRAKASDEQSCALRRASSVVRRARHTNAAQRNARNDRETKRSEHSDASVASRRVAHHCVCSTLHSSSIPGTCCFVSGRHGTSNAPVPLLTGSEISAATELYFESAEHKSAEFLSFTLQRVASVASNSRSSNEARREATRRSCGGRGIRAPKRVYTVMYYSLVELSLV